MRQLVLWWHFFVLMHSALQFSQRICALHPLSVIFITVCLWYILFYLRTYSPDAGGSDLFAMLANKTTRCRETFFPPLTLLVRFEFARYNGRANTELPRPFEIKWPRAIRHRFLKCSQKFTPVKKEFILKAYTHNNLFITVWNYYYL